MYKQEILWYTISNHTMIIRKVILSCILFCRIVQLILTDTLAHAHTHTKRKKITLQHPYL